MDNEEKEVGFYVDHETAVNIALSMCIGDPCQLCGKPLTKEETRTAIWAGSAPAHQACWEARDKQ